MEDASQALLITVETWRRRMETIGKKTAETAEEALLLVLVLVEALIKIEIASKAAETTTEAVTRVEAENTAETTLVLILLVLVLDLETFEAQRRIVTEANLVLVSIV